MTAATARHAAPADAAPAAGETSLRLVFDPRGSDLEAAVACETDVFQDRFGETREHLDASFVGYEDASVFLALVDASGTAVASARLLVPGPAGTKTAEYMSAEPWGMDAQASMAGAGLDPATTWDVATLSVRRRSHATGALWTAALCHGLFQVARANGVSATVALMDEVARQRLAMMGIVYTTLPGASSQAFDGSPATTPVYADMQTMIDNQRRQLPDAYRLVGLGHGLDDIDLPPLAGFVLRRSVDLRERVVVPRQVLLSGPRAS